MPTYLSEAIYTANGATTDFAFNKGYLSRSHVVVKTSADAGVTFTTKTDGVDYNWIDSQTVRFVAAPANNTVVWIDRTTPLSLLVTYENGAVFTDDNQNTAYRHAIYVLQEQADDLQRRPDLNPLLDDAEASLTDAFVSDVAISGATLAEDKRTLDVSIGRDANGRLTITLAKSGTTQQLNTIPNAADPMVVTLNNYFGASKAGDLTIINPTKISETYSAPNDVTVWKKNLACQVNIGGALHKWITATLTRYVNRTTSAVQWQFQIHAYTNAARTTGETLFFGPSAATAGANQNNDQLVTVSNDQPLYNSAANIVSLDITIENAPSVGA